MTPAFLFAVLLWDDARRQVDALVDKGLEPSLAWQRASHQVVAAQARHVAIPRRFTRVMEEIWMLQPRFARRTRKRTFRLLEHPRFRAAYDFLLLRAAESDELRELGEWWTRAQELPADTLAQELAAGPVQPGAANDVAAPGPPKRRRRRARRRRKKPPAGQ